MSQRKNYKVNLISTGKIVPEIHYGPFSQEWWVAMKSDLSNLVMMLLSIRIGMKTFVELNGYEFFITVLEPSIENLQSLKYQAHCGLVQSEICTSSSAAIILLYQYLFGKKTKFSGLLIMGFNQSIIVQQLLEGIDFQPFEFLVGQLRIVVFEIGKSKNQEWNYAGYGYQSSFVDVVGKK